MPTFIVDARAIKQEGGKLWLELNYEDRQVEMTALQSQSLEEIALMILEQEFPAQPDQTLQRRYTIEAHQETVIDPEGDYQQWIVDSVTPEQLPDEAAQDGIDAMPGWASWTADEAEQWVVDNLTLVDPTLVTFARGVARMLVFLRDR